jgi:hypothetical protein
VLSVRTRVVDLCTLTRRKYEVVVSVILCLSIDAMVVGEKATAIEYVVVSSSWFTRLSFWLR